MNSLDANSRPALAPGVRLQLDKATGEIVLLYPEGVLELNRTAHAIVNLCNGATALEQIVAALSAEYEVEDAVVRADAMECVGDLVNRRLMTLQT
jgi:pyrroloquinoline quinone biosynthesis protein D